MSSSDSSNSYHEERRCEWCVLPPDECACWEPKYILMARCDDCGAWKHVNYLHGEMRDGREVSVCTRGCIGREMRADGGTSDSGKGRCRACLNRRSTGPAGLCDGCHEEARA